MEKLSPWRAGSAMVLIAAVTSIVCAVAVYLFPDGTVAFVNSWLHGLDLAALRSDRPWTVSSFLLGLFNVTLTGFAAGTLFAFCRNLTAGR